MPKTFVHIWSDVAGDFRPSTENGAIDHADHDGHGVVGVESIAGLADAFRHFKTSRMKIDRLDFHTHGAPGLIAIGAEILTWSTLSNRFAGHGFDAAFDRGARVFFHGCNVADSADGEMFLAVFGAIFLRTGGGRVGASTSVGFGLPLIGGRIAHFWGTTVYAHVQPGGSVRLENHEHLDPEKIARRLARVEKTLEARARVSNGPGVRRVRRLLEDARKTLAAKALTFGMRLDAATTVSAAESAMGQLTPTPGHRRRMHEREWRMMTQSMPSFR